MVRKKQGFAKRISGYGGQKYALFDLTGERKGTSTFTGSETDHKKELRGDGYTIKRGYVRG